MSLRKESSQEQQDVYWIRFVADLTGYNLTGNSRGND
jgi:hypothetical protein